MGAPQKLLDAADDADDATRAAVSLVLDLSASQSGRVERVEDGREVWTRPKADEDADGRDDDSGSAELYTCIWTVYISGTHASL